MAGNVVPLLVVDDRPENIVALKAMLSEGEYRFVEALSGEEALAAVLREDFAVILLDVSMPGMSGFEVAELLKHRERTRHVPILFVTAVAVDLAQAYQAYTVGAVDYLIKPLDPRVVRAKVAVFADLYRKRVENERQAKLLAEHERRAYELRLAELRFAFDQRYRKLIEGIDHAIAWTMEPDTLRLTFLSRRARAILGYPEERFAEQGFWLRSLHPDDRPGFEAAVRDAAAKGTDQTYDHRIVTARGQARWFHTGISFEPAGEELPAALHGLSVDVTSLKRAARSERFLADVSAVLAERLEHDEAWRRLARAVVAELADWCWIETLEGDELRPFTIAHADPSLAPLAAETVGRIRRDRSWRERAERVLREGSPVIWPAPPNGEPPPPAPRKLPDVLHGLDAASYMIVRLDTRGKALGVMTFVSTRRESRFDAADLALATDLARRSALAADNARLYEEALVATRARDRLIGVVSHDLKSPLSTIVMSAALLRDAALPHKASRAVDTIERAAGTMTRLIGDLVDIERIELDRLRVETRPQGVSSLLADAAALLEPLTAAKEISLHVGSDDVPSSLRVLCDRDRVMQVFSNLVGNALKFAPRGSRIEVRAEPGEGLVRFAVSDQGPGIAPDALPHVFDRFWQGDESTHLGLGLGLAIAKGIVEAHGGAIGVESEPGRGATFHFTLRSEERVPVEAADAPERDRPDSGQSGRTRST